MAKTGRPNYMPHSHATLRVLAEQLKTAAKRLVKQADELQNAAGDDYVSVGHSATVADGADAVALLILDVQKKIATGKFSKDSGRGHNGHDGPRVSTNKRHKTTSNDKGKNAAK
jgi:hypothetical protein